MGNGLGIRLGTLFAFVRTRPLAPVAYVGPQCRAQPGLRGRKAGMANIPKSQREGLGDPADPPQAYVNYLREVLSSHGDKEVDDARLARFVQAQITWDRAMAEALADGHHPNRVIVGISGSGHLRYGHGIPHQLSAIGYASTYWLPVSVDDCTDLPEQLADAVFVLDEPPPAPARPRLGVGLDQRDGQLIIASVGEDSIAQSAGMSEGDVLVSAGGQAVESTTDLAAIIALQAPGSWLPLIVERMGIAMTLIAQFPPPEPREIGTED